MSAQTATIMSGVVLLVVFAMVGLTLRRGRTRDEEGPSHKEDGR